MSTRLRVDRSESHRLEEAIALFAASMPQLEAIKVKAYKALAGALLRADWKARKAEQFILEVSIAVGDKNTNRRVALVKKTQKRLRNAETATGWPRLQKFIGDEPTLQLYRLLGLEKDCANSSDFSGGSGLEVVTMSDIVPESPEWLIDGLIPKRMLTNICGDGGVGKSTITLDIAARITTGVSGPLSGKATIPGEVLILTTEDDLSNTIAPRLIAAGAALDKVHVVTAVMAGKKGAKRPVSILEDIGRLKAHLKKNSKIVLIIIDPLSDYLKGVDSHKNAEVREVLAHLNQLKDAAYNVSIICVHHLNKSEGKGAMGRVMGSQGFTTSARMGWFAIEDNDQCLLVPYKNNIGPKEGGIAYTIRPAVVEGNDGEVCRTSLIEWGEHVEGNANDWLDLNTARKQKVSREDAVLKWIEKNGGEATLSEIQKNNVASIKNAEDARTLLYRMVEAPHLVRQYVRRGKRGPKTWIFKIKRPKKCKRPVCFENQSESNRSELKYHVIWGKVPIAKASKGQCQRKGA